MLSVSRRERHQVRSISNGGSTKRTHSFVNGRGQNQKGSDKRCLTDEIRESLSQIRTAPRKLFPTADCNRGLRYGNTQHRTEEEAGYAIHDFDETTARLVALNRRLESEGLRRGTGKITSSDLQTNRLI